MPMFAPFQAAREVLREKLTVPSGPTQGRLTLVLNFVRGGYAG